MEILQEVQNAIACVLETLMDGVAQGEIHLLLQTAKQFAGMEDESALKRVAMIVILQILTNAKQIVQDL